MTKEMWNKLQIIYEGDEKVKEVKLQTFKTKFEGLKMEEDDNIETYFLIVDEIVKSIRGIGETLDDLIVVKKVLRSLPDRYDPKVSTLEKSRELKNLKVDEPQGILIAYEMRKQDKPSKHEVAFKT